VQLKVVLAENFRAVFYAPFYACLELGFFRQAGLAVELVASPSPGAGIAEMLAGRTHLVWGGPLRVLKDRDGVSPGPQSLVAFGEVAARDPFFLMGRPTEAAFDFGRLPSLRLSTVGEVPTPWLCLQQDLRDAGIDPRTLVRSSDASMPEQLKALAEGRVDVIQVFEPFVAQAEAASLGQVLYAAHQRGETAYTSFISTEEHLLRYGEVFQAMAQAITAFPDWLQSEGGAGLARLVSPYYPHLPVEQLGRALNRYQAARLWSCRPEISRVGFDRLALSMLSGGFIRQVTPYETCVAPWAQQHRV
jgi:NitT/TauT family transport system substrate-binding protein